MFALVALCRGRVKGKRVGKGESEELCCQTAMVRLLSTVFFAVAVVGCAEKEEFFTEMT